MTRSTPPHGATTGRRLVVLAPGRDDLVDAGILMLLMLLALVGFRTTYDGWTYLIVGFAGTLLGLLIGHVANALRQPMIAVAAMTLAVFFLAGGAIALHSTAVAGIVPSGSTFHGLADETVHGWKDLLTTLPPVDGTGPLLVLPYLLGLLGGVGGLCLARRTARSAAPVAAPFAVLVTVILLGTQAPAARLLQGAVFGAGALGWIALRAARRRPPIQNGTGRLTRFATVGAVLAVAFGGAAIIGPHVPGVGSHKRVVLRSYVTPPFDVDQYPSPLAGFRKYRKNTTSSPSLYDTALFSVHGLRPGTYVRIATLDDYDGLTWRAADQSGSPGAVPDTFQRVGTVIDDPAAGTRATFTVTIDGYSDVWLPDAGALRELTFHGPDAGSHASYFRYNLATGTGIAPDGLRQGDSYTASAVLPAVPDLRSTDVVASSGAGIGAAADFARSTATSWGKNAANPTTRVLNIAAHLRAVGKYSDGTGPDHQFYLPGHYADRLTHFLHDPQIVGDDEQFAAAYALMINDLGTPARVVLGAELPASGVVKGANVDAWVEVQLQDGSWRTIPTDRFMNAHAHPHKETRPNTPPANGKIVPPPAQARQRSSVDDASDVGARALVKPHPAPPHGPAPSGSGLPGWILSALRWGGPPVLVVALVVALIVGLKWERRRRRRTRGPAATRFAHGWLEIVDHARDLGTRLPVGRTRREQARLLATHQVDALARAADANVFGPRPPGDTDATAYWAEIARARKRMSGSVGRWRRIKAALSLASFRRTSPLSEPT